MLLQSRTKKNEGIIQINIVFTGCIILFVDYVDIAHLLEYIDWNIDFHTDPSSVFADICTKTN